MPEASHRRAYVILRHEPPPEAVRPAHWDFMIQVGNVLRTWALADEPQPEKTVAAEALPDHRLAYLDYEGPISGGRGTVVRWDEGTYQTLVDTPDRLVLVLAGRRISGRVHLERTAPAGRDWRFRYWPEAM